MKGEKLLTASDLAEVCQVDLKTIHNWADSGKAPASFRTPGRHLRFKAADAVPWLTKQGFTVPNELKAFLPMPEEKLAKDLAELGALVERMTFVERGDLLQRAREVVGARTGAAA